MIGGDEATPIGHFLVRSLAPTLIGQWVRMSWHKILEKHYYMYKACSIENAQVKEFDFSLILS